jgi:hypothetical protein
MDITLAYAIGFGAMFGMMILIRPIYRLTQIVCPIVLEVRNLRATIAIARYLSRLVSGHFTFPTVLRRGKYIDRWSRTDVLLLLAYFGANVSCILVRFPGISEAGLRAGMLSLINMILLFAGPHLSFLADVLGVSIRTCRRLHIFAGLVSIVLAMFHAIVGAATKGKFSLEISRNLWALTVGVLPPALCRTHADIV